MDRPLLQITTTPARYEYEVMRAKLEMSKETKPAEPRRVSRAQANMRRQAAGRFEMNAVRRRSDMGVGGQSPAPRAAAPTGAAAPAATVNRLATLQTGGQGAQTAQAAQSAPADYSQYAGAAAKAGAAGGGSVSDTVWGQSMQHSQGDLVLMPLSSDDIHYIPASLAGGFSPGDTSTNWNVGKARLDFVPSSFSMNFTQYASVNIEYTGGFIYVPPSSDPNYEGRA